jgi:hypothetical protein
LRGPFISKDRIEFRYRSINHSNRAKLSDRNGFALLFLSVLYVLYLTMPEPIDDVLVSPLGCQFTKKKASSVGGNIPSSAPASVIAHSKPPRCKCSMAACIRRIEAYRMQVSLCCGLPMARSRRVILDPLGWLQFTLKEIPYVWRVHGIIAPGYNASELLLDCFGGDDAHQFTAFCTRRVKTPGHDQARA